MEPQQKEKSAHKTKYQFATKRKGILKYQPYKGKNARDMCAMEMFTGPCKAMKMRYYYNVEKGQCEQFVFGGCKQNGNNFKTKKECEAVCVK